MQMLARHDAPRQSVEGFTRDGEAMAARFVGGRGVRAVEHVLERADAFENAQSVVPEIDARAESTQLGALLMQAYAPAALRERGCRSQAAKAPAGDLRMQRLAVVLVDVRHLNHRAYQRKVRRPQEAGERPGAPTCPARPEP